MIGVHTLDKWQRWDLNSGQTPEPMPPGDADASPQEKPPPSHLVRAQGGTAPFQAGVWSSLLARSGHCGEVGSVQITALLPRGHRPFGRPRAVVHNTTAGQRVSGFRWPRKAKFIFLEPWSGNVTPLSSTAPRSPQAQIQTPRPGEQALANSFNLIPRFSVSTLCSSEASCLSVSHPHTA